ncbi:hypothetical protein ANCDUO_16852 [Ancylostoma duodenale]|uniref:Uncharacterized protein n=1 Tax=Ancylostoma duodenale TaxID=51022 RepID=A0A0C2G7J7_9BILA|nr:hypothetical protein ANCDUO_16852 [Ancylostoma duodenale]
MLKGKPPVEERMISRRQKRKHVMVCAGMPYNDKTPLILVPGHVNVHGLQYCAILQTAFCPGSDGILERRCGPSTKKRRNALREAFRTPSRWT